MNKTAKEQTEKLIFWGCEVLSNQWQLDAETARAIMRQLLILSKEAGLKFVPDTINLRHIGKLSDWERSELIGILNSQIKEIEV